MIKIKTNKKGLAPSRVEGFTLIEMLTAVSLFLVIMTISMGAILNVFDINKKSESMKTVMDNLNFSLETMSREMRFGTNYNCIGIINCPNGGTSVSFTPSDPSYLANTTIIYSFNGTEIDKQINSPGITGPIIAVTAPEINIENLKFYVRGAGPGSGYQPNVLIVIKGKAGLKSNTTSEFSVQTLVSQRQLNL